LKNEIKRLRSGKEKIVLPARVETRSSAIAEQLRDYRIMTY